MASIFLSPTLRNPLPMQYRHCLKINHSGSVWERLGESCIWKNSPGKPAGKYCSRREFSLNCMVIGPANKQCHYVARFKTASPLRDGDDADSEDNNYEDDGG